MKYLRIVCLLTGLGLSLGMLGCAYAGKHGSSDAAQPAATDNKAMTRHQVAMLEFRFQPESLNVSTGDTVVWVNDHNCPVISRTGSTG